jgi:WD40 repeat protein
MASRAERMKVALSVLLLIGAFTAKASEPPKAKEQSRTDHFGDPLPPEAVRRIGSIHFRQGGTIRTLIPCPDGKTLVSGSYSEPRTVCVWELATGRLLRSFPTGMDARTAAVSPDGTILATTEGEAIRLWELATGRELHRLKGHRFQIFGLTFSPDGKILASSGTEDIRLWDTATGAAMATLPWKRRAIGFPLLAFSPDGKTLLVGETTDSKVHLWDVATRRERGQHEVNTTMIRGFAQAFTLSSDSRILAIGIPGATSDDKGQLSLWDMTTGKLIRQLFARRRVVSQAAFSPDGKLLAASEGDPGEAGSICVWDVATGKRLFSHEGFASSLAFSFDGKILFEGGDVIRRWDVATGKEIQPPEGSLYGVGQLALSPDGKTLAAASYEDTVRLWDTATGKRLRDFSVAGGRLAYCAFSPDGWTLATASILGAFHLWDVATGKQRRVVHPPLPDKAPYSWMKGERLTDIAFAPDGKTLATSSREGTVCLWDARTGERLQRFSRKADFDAIAFTSNGRCVWTASRTRPSFRQEGTDVRAWDISRGAELPQLTAVMNARMAKIDSDGRFSAFTHLAVSGDGRMLAVNREKTISVWEAASGRERLVLKGQSEPTLCAAFSPDCRLLASAARDGTFRLWDLATGTELARLSGHRGRINALVFSPDGKLLYSGGDDTSILVSDVSRVVKNILPAVSGPAASTAWDDLAGDATKAYRAIHALRADPAGALPLLGKHLRPAAPVDEKRVAEWIRDLDATEFARRETASQELEKLGEGAEPALRQALRGKPSLELQRRIDGLLEKLVVPGPEALRQLLAVEVLEHIGNDEARRMLHKLAEGAPKALLTREAKAALERLSGHRGEPSTKAPNGPIR